MPQNLRFVAHSPVTVADATALWSAAAAGDLVAVEQLRQLDTRQLAAVAGLSLAAPQTSTSNSARTVSALSRPTPAITLQSGLAQPLPTTQRAFPDGGLRSSPERPGSGVQPLGPARAAPRSTDTTMPSEIGHMAFFPRAPAVTAQRSPRWVDRAPVYVDGVATATQTVSSSADVIGALTTALGLPLTLFSGSGDLKAQLRGKRMTSLKARVYCVFQANESAGAGDPPDVYAAEQLESVLSRLVVTLYADATNTYALRPVPMRSLAEGFIFPDGTEPFCDDDDFRMEVTAPSDLPTFTLATSSRASAELYVEAVFE